MNATDEKKLFEIIIDKLAQNILSVQRSSRKLAEHVLQSIAKDKGKSLSEILNTVNCSIYVPPPTPQRQQMQSAQAVD